MGKKAPEFISLKVERKRRYKKLSERKKEMINWAYGMEEKTS